MARFIMTRFMQMVMVLFFLTVVTFILMKLAPGDPVRTILNVDEVQITNEQEEELRSELYLDEPVRQYWHWLQGVVQLDLGTSYASNTPVREVLLARLPNTLLLTGGGIVVMVVMAAVLGLTSAFFYNRPFDHISRVLALVGASLPSFWLGLLLIQWFSLHLGWLPSSGTSSWQHLILPSVTLGVAMSAVYARLLRVNLVEELSQPYILAAKARGISSWTLLSKHSLRAAIVPILSLFGLSLGSLLGGAVVVETVFSWPGLGSMVIDAILKRDYPLIQGYILITGAFVITVNFIIDVVTTMLDPRIGEEPL
ncbi:nickel ABC transporter permease [Salsuginibacillus kocurii]|uniref:nickel ABC transporter permease n=1 Tax=Salsuginibacillus kocurii TaxID=427078 RepID=UPI000378FFA7|nr:nickel ABC transporter permease [Salsuginibacillus kocurii]